MMSMCRQMFFNHHPAVFLRYFLAKAKRALMSSAVRTGFCRSGWNQMPRLCKARWMVFSDALQRQRRFSFAIVISWGWSCCLARTPTTKPPGKPLAGHGRGNRSELALAICL